LALPQPAVRVYRAEVSEPFGTVSGKLVAVDDVLLFVDDEKPESSFAIRRNDIRTVKAEGRVVTVQTAQPVQSRSVQTSTLTFRLRDDDTGFLSQWHLAAPPGASAPVQSDRAITPEPMSFEAKHDHRVGSCRGRLIVTANGLGYESIDEINHSRQWELKDIKELRRDSPYEIKIQPFNGGEYELELQGHGMDNKQLKILVDRITSARVTR
jgi:hypothetical protein